MGNHHMPGNAMMMRRAAIAVVMATATVAVAASANAADVIRVGKASATTFAFAPIEIGKEKGIWAKYGLDVESIGFGGEGRLLVEFGEHVKDFHTHVIFATKEIVTRHPDQVRRFLAGWRDVIAFMAANRAETIRLVAPVSGLPEDIQTREYDKAMPMMS